MSARSKTGGGVGTNQYQIKGQSTAADVVGAGRAAALADADAATGDAPAADVPAAGLNRPPAWRELTALGERLMDPAYVPDVADIELMRRGVLAAVRGSEASFTPADMEMAHIDGRLGDSKPTLMLTEIERLRAEVAFLERLVMNVAVRCVRDPEVAEDMVADEREQMQS